MTSARGTYIRDLLNKVEAANQPGRGSGAMGHSWAAEVALLTALVEAIERLEALTEGACFPDPAAEPRAPGERAGWNQGGNADPAAPSVSAPVVSGEEPT